MPSRIGRFARAGAVLLAGWLLASHAHALDASTLSQADAVQLIDDLFAVRTAGEMCGGVDYSDFDAGLIDGAIELLQDRLKMSKADLDEKHYAKAFNAYEDDPDSFCKTWAPQVNEYVVRIR